VRLSDSFLGLAKDLQKQPDDGAQRQTISCAYYAVFHRFAELCTQAVLGQDETVGVERFTPEWIRVYRAIDHNALREQIKRMSEASDMLPERRELWKYMSSSFSDLQISRHSADYDPSFGPISLNISHSSIKDAELLIKSAEASPSAIILKLAIEVLLKNKPTRR
jgi:uncharacterized protein (UPF0332 family)